MENDYSVNIVIKKQKPLVTLAIKGESYYFMIDTTSVFGCIDKTFAAEKGLHVAEYEGEMFTGLILSMSGKKVSVLCNVADMDTSLYVGTLGMSFFKRNGLVIDFKNMTVYGNE